MKTILHILSERTQAKVNDWISRKNSGQASKLDLALEVG